ncbi:hypothetical protein ACWGJ1_25085 [Bacillus wiedmannii]|uniref:hypothetical protein n=1 Tax=Bacillus wiedmannii TaxID=1890302 RepID=UPI0035E39F3F
MQKIAVAIIHGIGEQRAEFADKMIEEIKKLFASQLNDIVDNPTSQLVFKPIHWAKLFAEREKNYFKQLC